MAFAMDTTQLEGAWAVAVGPLNLKSIVGTFGAAPALLPNQTRDTVDARNTLTTYRYDSPFPDILDVTRHNGPSCGCSTALLPGVGLKVAHGQVFRPSVYVIRFSSAAIRNTWASGQGLSTHASCSMSGFVYLGLV